jgi:hypothetical protein
MISSSIHLPTSYIISFLLVTDFSSIVYTYYILFIVSYLGSHQDWGHNLAIVNSAMKNINIQVSL